MSASWEDLAGDAGCGLLLIGDHASNRVPAEVALGVSPGIMSEHIAIDLGVAPLARALSVQLGMPGILGNVSRLVIDLNRERDAAGLVPETSDGHAIPGNSGLSSAGLAERIDRYWIPYHEHIAELITTNAPKLLISLHSFTPRLRAGGGPRPWEVGILYNQDARAAQIAMPLLEAAGIVTGDNEPYSGKVLNATMNRHGEGNGIAYLGVEVRQDLIGDAGGVARWCRRLAPVILATAAAI